MNAVTLVMVGFSMLGALDRILGSRLGLGREFEKGIQLLGTLALSMIGMIVISPWLAAVLQPVFGFMASVLHMEPSIVPASLFANDMGGAPLAAEIAVDRQLGMFNALVVASMMGCTVSFTIPYALSAVGRDQQRELLLGMLCGIVTIPVGCMAAGLMLQLPVSALLWNLLPLLLFAGLIAIGLMVCPDRCAKVFEGFGVLIKILITLGLALGILRFLTGVELLPGLATLEEGGIICLNASAVMTGAFPMLYLLEKALSRPLKALSRKIGVTETAVTGFLSSLATSTTTFALMKDMNRKGVLLNAAFAISAAFTFADHLAFTMAYDTAYIWPMIVGKLTAGCMALLLANLLWPKFAGKKA